MPLIPELMLNHGALLKADHWHPPAVTRLKVPEAARAEFQSELGDVPKVQLAWVGTWNWFARIVSNTG
jgi:hypothetical protein